MTCVPGKIGPPLPKPDVALTIENGKVHIEEIRYIDVPLATVNLKPDDRLVVMYPKSLSHDAAERMRRQFEAWAPGRSVIILTDGMTLGVVSPEEAK
jgi:hypothetical protein